MYRCIDAGWDPSPGPRVSPPRLWAQKEGKQGPNKKKRPKTTKKRPKKITPPFTMVFKVE